jgi:hypothetical protein
LLFLFFLIFFLLDIESVVKSFVDIKLKAFPINISTTTTGRLVPFRRVGKSLVEFEMKCPLCSKVYESPARYTTHLLFQCLLEREYCFKCDIFVVRLVKHVPMHPATDYVIFVMDRVLEILSGYTRLQNFSIPCYFKPGKCKRQLAGAVRCPYNYCLMQFADTVGSRKIHLLAHKTRCHEHLCLMEETRCRTGKTISKFSSTFPILSRVISTRKIKLDYLMD